MSSFRLRIELPSDASTDEGVGSAISTLGGRVVSVDLHEVEGPAAVDELVVDLPGDIDQTELRSALTARGRTTLLSSRRCDRDEPFRRARRWVAETGHDDPELHHPSPELTRLVASACPQATVWVCDSHNADMLPAVKMAYEREAPVVHRTNDLPLQLAPPGSRSLRWLLAVPDRYREPDSVALLSRPISLRFTADEVALVQLLVAS